MVEICFYGQIFPPEPKIDLICDYGVSVEQDTIDPKCNLHIKIVQSSIEVFVEGSNSIATKLSHVYKRVYDLCSSTVGLLSFRYGCGLSFEITHYRIDKEKTKPLLLMDIGLQNLATSVNTADSFTFIHKLVISNYQLGNAIFNLSEAITKPHASALVCARVIESICDAINSEETNKSKRWEKMQQALHVTPSYLKTITEASKSPRHGKIVYLPGEETNAIVKMTWVITNRFFDFKKNDPRGLSVEDYPLLTI